MCDRDTSKIPSDLTTLTGKVVLGYETDASENLQLGESIFLVHAVYINSAALHVRPGLCDQMPPFYRFQLAATTF